jgi:hypothetical protein
VTKIYDLITEARHNLAPDVELLEDDFEAALFTMTDIAVLMDTDLEEVLERVKGHYQVSLDDKRAGIGSWVTESIEEKELYYAVARARNLGVMTDEQILRRVQGTLDECESFRRMATNPSELKLVSPEPGGPDWLRG